MLEGQGSKEEVDTLKKHVESTRSFESDITHQRLNLWTMLTNLAAELSGEKDDIVSTVGLMTHTNTDHIKDANDAQDQYSLASVLKAFW